MDNVGVDLTQCGERRLLVVTIDEILAAPIAQNVRAPILKNVARLI